MKPLRKTEVFRTRRPGSDSTWVRIDTGQTRTCQAVGSFFQTPDIGGFCARTGLEDTCLEGPGRWYANSMKWNSSLGDSVQNHCSSFHLLPRFNIHFKKKENGDHRTRWSCFPYLEPSDLVLLTCHDYITSVLPKHDSHRPNVRPRWHCLVSRFAGEVRLPGRSAVGEERKTATVPELV